MSAEKYLDSLAEFRAAYLQNVLSCLHHASLDPELSLIDFHNLTIAAGIMLP